MQKKHVQLRKTSNNINMAPEALVQLLQKSVSLAFSQNYFSRALCVHMRAPKIQFTAEHLFVYHF